MKEELKNRKVTLNDINKQSNELLDDFSARAKDFQDSIKNISYWKENPLLILGVSSVLILISSTISFILGRISKSNDD